MFCKFNGDRGCHTKRNDCEECILHAIIREAMILEHKYESGTWPVSEIGGIAKSISIMWDYCNKIENTKKEERERGRRTSNEAWRKKIFCRYDDHRVCKTKLRCEKCILTTLLTHLNEYRTDCVLQYESATAHGVTEIMDIIKKYLNEIKPNDALQKGE